MPTDRLLNETEISQQLHCQERFPETEDNICQERNGKGRLFVTSAGLLKLIFPMKWNPCCL